MTYLLVLGLLASLALSGTWVWSMCRIAAKVAPTPPGCDERGLYDACGEVFDPIRHECWHTDVKGPYWD